MATKVYLLLAALVLAGAAAMPIAHAQNAVINIADAVPCTLSLGGPTSDLLAPGFPNADTSLMCVVNVNDAMIISNTTTDSNRQFLFSVRSPYDVSIVLGGRCDVVVTTPLSSCNSTLPSTGYLRAPVVQSPATSRGVNYGGLVGINVLNYKAKNFVYVA